MKNNELVANLIGSETRPSSNIGRVEQLLRNIRADKGVKFFPMELVTLRGVNGLNIARDKSERIEAMQVNSEVVRKLYDYYQVDEDLTVVHIAPSSASTLHIHTERFSSLGIGFVENAIFARGDNPDMVAVVRKSTGMKLETGYPPTVDLNNTPVPQSFDVEVHEVVNGEMPYQYLD